MKKFFLFAILLLSANFIFTSSHGQCPNPGGIESDFGHDIWKVNVYEFGYANDVGVSWLPEVYSGYYNDSSLNFDSQNKWDPNSNPSTVPGYQGCGVYDDYISWSAKRQGFPCGIYRIDIVNHDDEADLIIDGKKMWKDENANTNPTLNVWTGPLNASSKVEFLVTEGEGSTNGAINFVFLGTTGSIVDVAGHPIVCTGQFYTLTSTIAGANYAWSTGATTNTVNAYETGSYSVIVTDDQGCELTSAPVNLTILSDAAPVAHISSSANSTCNWETVSLSSDSTSGNVWSTTATTQGIAVNIPGDYILTLTNNAGCFDQSTAHITGGFTPSSPVAINSGPVCEGSAVNLSANGLAPGGKTASFNNVWVQVEQDIPENDFTIEMWVKTTELTTGLFSARDFSTGWDRDLYLNNGQLYAQVADGHILNSGISINDGKWHHIALTVETGAGTRIYIDGGLAPNTDPYDHADVNQDAFYLGISLPAGGSSNLFEGEMDNVRIWSEVRSENDIRSNMALETPITSTNLVYHCSLNGNINAEVGNNGIAFTGFGPLNYTDANYYTYSWTGEGAPASSTSETQITAALSTSSMYSVTAGVNGCPPSVSASTMVTVTPAASYYADVDEDDYGDANVLVQTCDAAPEGYITDHTDCNDGNGAVHPGATDACNGLDDNCDNVVDENAIVATIVAPTGTVSVCKGTPVSFTANNGSGIAYQWIRNSVNIAGATNKEYSTSKKGSYQVNETNAFGCTSTSASVKVKILQPPAAVITALGNLDICTTGSVTLEANSGVGLTYLWTKGKDTIAGATNQSYTTNKKGTYHCIVTNANGCSKTSNVLKVTKECEIKEPYADAVAATTDLTVYPNPTTGRFMIDLNSSAGDVAECKIMVINMLGQVIYATDASMSDGALQQEINLSSGTTIAGVYFLRVLLDEEMYETKLVIQY